LRVFRAHRGGFRVGSESPPIHVNAVNPHHVRIVPTLARPGDGIAARLPDRELFYDSLLPRRQSRLPGGEIAPEPHLHRNGTLGIVCQGVREQIGPDRTIESRNAKAVPPLERWRDDVVDSLLAAKPPAAHDNANGDVSEGDHELGAIATTALTAALSPPGWILIFLRESPVTGSVGAAPIINSVYLKSANTSQRRKLIRRYGRTRHEADNLIAELRLRSGRVGHTGGR
jgi:hypothetical protein